MNLQYFNFTVSQVFESMYSLYLKSIVLVTRRCLCEQEFVFVYFMTKECVQQKNFYHLLFTYLYFSVALFLKSF